MTKRKHKSKPRQVPIEYYMPDDTITQYSDGLIVRHTPDVFIMSFLQLQHPLAFAQEDIAKITKVKSKCIAQITLTPKAMRNFLDAMQTNFGRYTAKHGEVESAHESDEMETEEGALTVVSPRGVEGDDSKTESES